MHDLGGGLRSWGGGLGAKNPYLHLKNPSKLISDLLYSLSFFEDEEYLSAYREVLETRESIEMWFVKAILLGPPGLGKTTFRRRLRGEISDISSSGEDGQPSTGAVDSGRGVYIRNLSSTTTLISSSKWQVIENPSDEACMLFQLIYGRTPKNTQEEAEVSEGQHAEPQAETASTAAVNDDKKMEIEAKEAAPSVNVEPISTTPPPVTVLPVSKPSDPTQHRGESSLLDVDVSQVMIKLLRDVGSKFWKDVKCVFEDTTYLKMEDTGGQPEFMDMLPALTIGPALYLLFCKLIDDLYSCYTVTYRSPSGKSTTPVESTYTVEEVILSALASIACFKSGSKGNSNSSELTSSGESKAYILGTHKDQVSQQQIALFDEKLQHSIRSTDFFNDHLVEFSSDDRMIFPIDNMKGGEVEIKKIQKFLEEGLKQHFKKLRIPAAWLMLSLFLRESGERITSLDSVINLAKGLQIPEEEVELALWFLHHRAGVLMYFPKLPELADTVICDPQVVYDSTTNLIVDTFRFGPLPKAAAEKFRETGQFSLNDIRSATASVSGVYIPLEKLVKLLEHLNIIAPFHQSDSASSQGSSHDSKELSTSTTTQSSKQMVYFMPCIIQNVTREELDKWWQEHSVSFPPALFIHYECGFVPIGIFPALVANLVASKKVKLIVDGMKKNRVQFRYGRDRDKITLITQPKCYAIHIERRLTAKRPAHEVCSDFRNLVQSSLETVTSYKNYSFCAQYQWAFRCPLHPNDREHLCVIDQDDISDDYSFPEVMSCMGNTKDPEPVDMGDQHKVWFGKVI